MSMNPRGPYRRRRARFTELWHVGDWRVKVYALTLDSLPLTPSTLSQGKRVAEKCLAQASGEDLRNHGVAILTVHDGEDGHYALIDWWSDNSILRRHNYGAPTGNNEPMEYEWSGPGACVWELAVTVFERAAWIEHVLSPPGGPDLPAYFAARLDGDV